MEIILNGIPQFHSFILSRKIKGRNVKNIDWTLSAHLIISSIYKTSLRNYPTQSLSRYLLFRESLPKVWHHFRQLQRGNEPEQECSIQSFFKQTYPSSFLSNHLKTLDIFSELLWWLCQFRKDKNNFIQMLLLFYLLWWKI